MMQCGIFKIEPQLQMQSDNDPPSSGMNRHASSQYPAFTPNHSSIPSNSQNTSPVLGSRRPNGEFMCGLCGQTFPNAPILGSHLVAHRAQNVFNCSVCYQSFNRQGLLRAHMNTCHPEDSATCVNCPVCGQICPTEAVLEVPLRFHHH